jgi:uncharacterized protein YkwD
MFRNKIIFALVLSALIPTTFAYSDVESGSEYYDSVSYLSDKDVVEGYGGDEFKPENKINRAEFIKILIEAAFDDIPPATEECFTDVSTELWYAPYVCYAKQQNIVGGYEDGTFLPEKNINFAEAAKIIVRSLSIESSEPAGSEWYSEFTEALLNKNYVPRTINYYVEEIIRGEMAEIVYRAMENIQNKDAETLSQISDIACEEFIMEEPKNVDMDRVRETFLSWYTNARASNGLSAYKYNEQLDRTAYIWSKYSAERGYIDHKRVGQSAYYDYSMIEDWFRDLGLTFENVNRATFTENIGWDVYSCDEEDCTDELLEVMENTFDFYMSEKNDEYRPHYNSIMQPYFKEMGVGVYINEEQNRYYLTVHYATSLTSQPVLCD